MDQLADFRSRRRHTKSYFSVKRGQGSQQANILLEMWALGKRTRNAGKTPLAGRKDGGFHWELWSS
jgi:hypothetical protein